MITQNKLKVAEIRKLRGILDDLSFSCGADVQEGLTYLLNWRSNVCEVMNQLRDFAIRPILTIFVYTVLEMFHPEEFYPQCDNCADKPRIAKCKEVLMSTKYNTPLRVHQTPHPTLSHISIAWIQRKSLACDLL